MNTNTDVVAVLIIPPCISSKFQSYSQNANNSPVIPLSYQSESPKVVEGMQIAKFSSFSTQFETQINWFSAQFVTGFFIALCFTTTKKVRGLLKERLCKPLWNVRAESQTSVTRDKYTGNADVGPAAGSMNMNCLSRDKTKQYTF